MNPGPGPLRHLKGACRIAFVHEQPHQRLVDGELVGQEAVLELVDLDGRPHPLDHARSLGQERLGRGAVPCPEPPLGQAVEGPPLGLRRRQGAGELQGLAEGCLGPFCAQDQSDLAQGQERLGLIHRSPMAAAWTGSPQERQGLLGRPSEGA